jgi:hypothetical protein
VEVSFIGGGNWRTQRPFFRLDFGTVSTL